MWELQFILEAFLTVWLNASSMGAEQAKLASSTDLPPGDPAAFPVPADATIENMHVLPKERRHRKLTDHYRMPASEEELGRGKRTPLSSHNATPPRSVCAGHYGVVKIGHRIIDGEPFAVKTIMKKRPLYVLMMVCLARVALRPTERNSLAAAQ